MKNKLTYKFCIPLLIVSLFAMPVNVKAQSSEGEDIDDSLPMYEENFEFKTVNMDGTIESVYVEDGFQHKEPEINPLLKGIGGYAMFSNINNRDVSYGVVNFKTKACSVNTIYKEEESGRSGYTNGCYGADGAYLGTVNGKVRFMQSGVIGLVDASEVEILDYHDSTLVKSVNFYRVEQGRIRHYITTNVSVNSYSGVLDIGPAQSYMSNNVVYYSYDGHYFYTTYDAMINDYKNNTRSNSINSNNPYYSYFQYLSHRSKTSISASQFNSTAVSNGGSASLMATTGSTFIEAQNAYGANALITYGTAANESAWGTSNIAKTKNNLFGHQAYDSDPDAAGKYNSPAESILAHAKTFVSINYMDPKDYFDNYQGPHLGDKQNGFNVRYASDPYWGEKNAAVAYAVDRANGNVDIGKSTIGIVDASAVSIRKEASTSSTKLYSTNTPGNVPVLILEEVQGESVNGNTKWYKIQTDAPLTSDRSSIIQDVGDYNFNNSYGYISAEYVRIANVEVPISGDLKKGDVNGDGKVSSLDYILIKNHITGAKTLSGDVLKRADVNEDGKVSSLDYVKVKNHITGANPLF